MGGKGDLKQAKYQKLKKDAYIHKNLNGFDWAATILYMTSLVLIMNSFILFSKQSISQEICLGLAIEALLLAVLGYGMQHEAGMVEKKWTEKYEYLKTMKKQAKTKNLKTFSQREEAEKAQQKQKDLDYRFHVIPRIRNQLTIQKRLKQIIRDTADPVEMKRLCQGLLIN